MNSDVDNQASRLYDHYMILLIGYANWAANLKRTLTDRTNLHPTQVITEHEIERLRGSNEHVEIIISGPAMELLSPAQHNAIETAQYHNETRSAKRSDGRPARISDGMPYWP